MNEPFRINECQCPPNVSQLVYAIGHAALLRPEKKFAVICRTDLGKKYLEQVERTRDEYALAGGYAWPERSYVNLRNAIFYRDDVPKGELHVIEAYSSGAPRDEDPLVVLCNIDADWDPLNRRKEVGRAWAWSTTAITTIEQLDAFRPIHACEGEHLWEIGFLVEDEGLHGSRFEGTLDQAMDALRDQIRPYVLDGRGVRHVALVRERYA